MPEVVLNAVQRTFELGSREVALRDATADRARLREIEAELANFALFAAKIGNMEETAGLYAERKRKREAIRVRLRGPRPRLDIDAVRPRVLERAEELRSVESECG